MNHYLNIKIISDDEVPLYFVRNKIFTKLHKVLCDLKSNDIGISFPHYQVNLGNVLRIHGSEGGLEVLQSKGWLGGLIGYCDVKGISVVPSGVQHRMISRVQSNMTEAKLRRLRSRHSISPEEERNYKAKMFTHGLDHPYVELESKSTGRLYRRYICFGEVMPHASEGSFDQFGLSKTASIPWF